MPWDGAKGQNVYMSNLDTFYTRKLNLVCYLGHNLGTFYARKFKFDATYPDLNLQLCAKLPLDHG